MRITARVTSAQGRHDVEVSTAGAVKTLAIPAKTSGTGSAVNGGELLFLALATCYCNDLYREAGKRAIVVESVEVEVQGDFPAEGEPASVIEYAVKLRSAAPEAQIRKLIAATDRVAEIQNTVRGGVPVTLTRAEVIGTKRPERVKARTRKR
jgi:organic hydroperoxide reductase OsmC/OhrA